MASAIGQNDLEKLKTVIAETEQKINTGSPGKYYHWITDHDLAAKIANAYETFRKTVKEMTGEKYTILHASVVTKVPLFDPEYVIAKLP